MQNNMNNLYYQEIEEKYLHDTELINKLNNNDFKQLIINPVKGEGYCLGLYLPITDKNIKNDNNFKNELLLNLNILANNLKNMSNNTCYIYLPGNIDCRDRPKLHTTILTLADFDNYQTILPLYYSYINDYHYAIKKSIKDADITNFDIVLKGLILTDTAIIIKGYPSFDINLLRDKLRDNFDKNSLKYKERYKNKIAHLTVFRFGKDKLTETQYNTLKKYVSVNSNTYFGKYSAKTIQLVSSGWTCSKNTSVFHKEFY
jgi:hypothetical protein